MCFQCYGISHTQRPLKVSPSISHRSFSWSVDRCLLSWQFTMTGMETRHLRPSLTIMHKAACCDPDPHQLTTHLRRNERGSGLSPRPRWAVTAPEVPSFRQQRFRHVMAPVAARTVCNLHRQEKPFHASPGCHRRSTFCPPTLLPSPSSCCPVKP